tara:strand:+ start:287 stop:1150 length:864 start_codon:yes stop_codon:yes gene_type:complete
MGAVAGTLATSDYQREFDFTATDFAYIRQQLKQHAGINLSDAKEDLVYSRLAKRLRITGLKSFAAYCDQVKQDPIELGHLINALTTNLTDFFREQHHFEHLKHTVIPELIRAKGTQRKLRIWSAGCSSGQEPYSIAMALLETLPNPELWDLRILASDLDSNMVETATQGVYSVDKLSGISLQRMQQWMRKGVGANAGMARTCPELRALIHFRQLNLMDEWPMQAPFDLIFCRNVVIYFDKPTQRQLFDRFANQLSPGGWLYIGHSETLNSVSDRFQLMGKSIYRKIR